MYKEIQKKISDSETYHQQVDELRKKQKLYGAESNQDEVKVTSPNYHDPDFILKENIDQEDVDEFSDSELGSFFGEINKENEGDEDED